MPRLSIVSIQSQRELLQRVEDLSMELHDLLKFQNGNYVEDVGPRMYLEYVRGLNTLARGALDVAKFYMMKQFLVDQEREIRETLAKRERGKQAERDHTPPAPADRPVTPRRERVRL